MNLYGLKQLVESARTVRQNTILIAEDIPESDYGYRPTQESRLVAEPLFCSLANSKLEPSIVLRWPSPISG